MPEIERQAGALEHRHPGVDWLPVLCDGLYLAAYTHDPGQSSWRSWLGLQTNRCVLTHLRTRLRRLSRLTPHPIEAVDEWVRQLL